MKCIKESDLIKTTARKNVSFLFLMGVLNSTAVQNLYSQKYKQMKYTRLLLLFNANIDTYKLIMVYL